MVNHEGIVPTAYVITRRIPDLQSLEKLDWQQEAANAPSHLEVAVKTMVALHTELLFHRDLEFKNVGPLDRQGSFAIFDLEWATSLRNLAATNDDASLDRLSRGVARDIDMICKSLKELVYPHMPNGPTTERDRLSYEMEHVYQPYATLLEQTGSPNAGLLTTALQTSLARRQDLVSQSVQPS